MTIAETEVELIEESFEQGDRARLPLVVPIAIGKTKAEIAASTSRGPSLDTTTDREKPAGKGDEEAQDHRLETKLRRFGREIEVGSCWGRKALKKSNVALIIRLHQPNDGKAGVLHLQEVIIRSPGGPVVLG